MLSVREDAGLAQRFREADCLFFDCDGVLFDSNGFKIDAMRHALEGQPPALVEQMLDYWRDNGGVSRWVKFRHYFERIAPSRDVEADVEQACERFGAYSLAAYGSREPVALALDVVRAAGAARSVVVSGAAQVELETVFAAKGIAPLFAAILGSPRTKFDLVRGVLDERGLSAGRTLFFGDGAGDFRVAAGFGIPFVYLDQFTEWTGAREALGQASNVTWADDWNELASALGTPPSR